MVQKKQKRFVVPHIPDNYRNEGAAGPMLFGRKGNGALPACSSTEQPPPVNNGPTLWWKSKDGKVSSLQPGTLCSWGKFQMLWFQRTLDIRNHSQRHKDYRNYWKSLKDLGFWENPDYLRSTTAAGISEDELRGYASLCLERCEETVSKPWWDTIYIWGISAFNFFNKLFCSFVFLIKLVPNIISKCFVFLL